ncbi:FadR/GntR family transcriptional regulator [Fusibacter ferrireducens]|uniref:FadR family transcriptional regulator n=1 Tax=Fusibacter ferrireducens TaxID=2785058 RepID=A0ABR9ZX69_9FIRM|nr:FCD domain-containing protein [Fusibacter ferrireducens]MBF4694743.1 FadR family transcriptional regulator [Fusibacter ferrireducens]
MNREIKPVINQSIPEIVSKNIIHFIQDNALRPGDRLPSERRMAETLKVSRTSLKKAIDILSHYGILEIRPQSGTYVNDLYAMEMIKKKVDHVEHLSSSIEWRECRACVEPSICRLCAERVTREELAVMKANLDRMLACYEANDMAATVIEDYKFHLSCVMATHNETLINMYQHYCGDFYQWMVSDYEPFYLEIAKEAMVQHKNLYNAFVSRDGALAELLSRQHNAMSISAWRSYKER